MRNIYYRFHGKELEFMPRSGYMKGVSDEDIFNLITSKAIIDEIMPNGRLRRLGLNNYVVRDDGTIEWIPIIEIPDEVTNREVTLANTSLFVTKVIDPDCSINLYNNETGEEAGEKSVEPDSNITRFTGLTQSTKYDLEVSRPVPDKEDMVLRSRKLTVTTKPTIVAPGAVSIEEVTVGDTKIKVTKAVDPECSIVLYNSGTEVEAGSKSVHDGVTTFTGLTETTPYDLYVTRTAPDYQGGGLLKSEKLEVTTEETVDAPGPVIIGEVELTNTKIVVTKELAPGCKVEVCSFGTTEETGSKSEGDGVVTVTNLTGDTQYDIYVTLVAPEYQDSVILRSPKLTVRTKPTIVAPAAVTSGEVKTTNTQIIVTKELEDECELVVCTKDTQDSIGSKEELEGVTTFSGLTQDTEYDIYVTRTAPEYQGGELLRSEKLRVRTKPTVVAPQPVINSEVKTTNVKVIVTKDIEEDCEIELCTVNTQETVGSKSESGNITTFADLTENTQYDLYVVRTAPEYQGGQKLRSTKLTVTTKDTVEAPGAVTEEEVETTNVKVTVTKEIDDDCQVVLCTVGTQDPIGSKQTHENVTTFTELTGDTQYDLYVVRTAPDYQDSVELRSEKLTIRTKPTVVAPEPVIDSEVETTNLKVVVTKDITEDCQIILCRVGTQESVGSKDVQGNVSTFTGLTHNTEYDVYVVRTAPDYQGGGELRSTKLTVRTKKTVEAPGPVIESEVETTDVKVTITKVLVSDCRIVLCNFGTLEPVSPRSSERNVTVFENLQPDTQYDAFVVRNAPDYQGGGELRSTKLTVRTKPRVVAPDPVLAEEAVATNTKITITKEIEPDCSIMVYNKGTEQEAGSKQVGDGNVTVTGLTQDTDYDVFVTRTAPDYQGGGLLKSTKLVVRTKPTVVAPGPVLIGEVELTNTKATITKTLAEGCKVIACNKGTEVEAGSHSVLENVTTITELTGDTEYDLYVTLKAPEYQGGQMLKSEKLAVRTKPTVVTPGPVLEEEVQATHDTLTITKSVEEGCSIMVYNVGTEEEAGSKQTQEAVTTVTGLTASTQYDIFVTRTAPEYQGGGVLKSSKLTVSTTEQVPSNVRKKDRR